jgi:spoIIIJ-associated protein
MIKIEASTLEDAYAKATLELECSVAQLRYEVIQYPSSGIFGFFKKNAIIVAECVDKPLDVAMSVAVQKVPQNDAIKADTKVSHRHSHDKLEPVQVKSNLQTPSVPLVQKTKHIVNEGLAQQDKRVLDSFFEEKHLPDPEQISKNNQVLAEEIELQLKELFAHSCFAIDTIEVDVVDHTALIFIDGDDAALLIGKEGYRYNALSYMIFNWLHAKYNLHIKLEIAQFLTSQQKMIWSYIQPVIEQVKMHGKGKTRALDGILVQIALEQLRAEFPEKYVAIKTAKDGQKFVVINEFNSQSHG